MVITYYVNYILKVKNSSINIYTNQFIIYNICIILYY